MFDLLHYQLILATVGILFNGIALRVPMTLEEKTIPQLYLLEDSSILP